MHPCPPRLLLGGPPAAQVLGNRHGPHHGGLDWRNRYGGYLYGDGGGGGGGGGLDGGKGACSSLRPLLLIRPPVAARHHCSRCLLLLMMSHTGGKQINGRVLEGSFPHSSAHYLEEAPPTTSPPAPSVRPP